MIRIGICDDDLQQGLSVKNIIDSWSQCPEICMIDVFNEGDALIQAHLKNPYDVLFLDIVMPLFNGMEIAKEIRNNDKTVKIIFLTSSKEYAVESYRVKASDYLLKPIAEEELKLSLLDCIHDIHSLDFFLTISNNGFHHRIAISEIEYFEAQAKHVLLTLKTGEKLKANEPLYNFEKLLEDDKTFFKCHRSYIVNLTQVASYSSKEVIMRSQTHLPLSRNLTKEFEQAYFNALFGKAGE